MSTLQRSSTAFDIISSEKKDKYTTEHVENVDSHTKPINDVLQPNRAALVQLNIRLVLPPSKLVPEDFTGYYNREAYDNDEDYRRGVRPKYTQRNLIDWEDNDLRSLLFFHELSEEWEGQVPVVSEPGYNVVILPLDASDSEIITTLAESDLYKDKPVSYSDRQAIARVAVEVARNGAPESEPLPLAEWRHMIENYLLNLGCEVQTRNDYHVLVNQLRRAKKASHGSSSLTVEERIAVWKSCQQSLYKRLQLNWSPDEV